MTMPLTFSVFLNKVLAEAIPVFLLIVDVWTLILYRSRGGFCNIQF